MQIEIYLPGPFDADVEFDVVNRKILITPTMIPKKAKEIAGVGFRVIGAAGKESRAVCTVHSGHGRVTAVNTDCGGVADFDSEKPTEEPVNEQSGTEES